MNEIIILLILRIEKKVKCFTTKKIYRKKSHGCTLKRTNKFFILKYVDVITKTARLILFLHPVQIIFNKKSQI
jgi:hypothetical protein